MDAHVCPLRLKRRTTSALGRLRERPRRFPSRRARVRPRRVRSRIRSRSNSATESSTPRISPLMASPPGRVSMPCVVTMNRTPIASSVWIFASTSSALRPNRSSFQTITASTAPLRAASSTRRNPGRSLRAPLPVSSTSRTTSPPCRTAAARVLVKRAHAVVPSARRAIPVPLRVLRTRLRLAGTGPFRQLASVNRPITFTNRQMHACSLCVGVPKASPRRTDARAPPRLTAADYRGEPTARGGSTPGAGPCGPQKARRSNSPAGARPGEAPRRPRRAAGRWGRRAQCGSGPRWLEYVARKSYSRVTPIEGFPLWVLSRGAHRVLLETATH